MNINRVTIAIFRTENPCVPGSIPGDTTSESESYRNVTLFFVLMTFPDDPLKTGLCSSAKFMDSAFG